jgi:hypothetical protein
MNSFVKERMNKWRVEPTAGIESAFTKDSFHLIQVYYCYGGHAGFC